MTHDVVNVLECGADPSGARDSTEAFRNALSKSRRVLVPAGIYKLSGMVQGELDMPEALAAETPPVAEVAHDGSE